MRRKPNSKPKLSDAERHERFVAMAKEVEAPETPESFEKAFDEVVRPTASPNEVKARRRPSL
jgi:hypothetical protein